MPFAAAVSTALDAGQATEEACKEARLAFGDASPDVGIVFFGPTHADAAKRIARIAHARLQADCVIGCLGESIIAGRREIENAPAIAVWLGGWNGKATAHGFRLQLADTADGPSLLGWPDAMWDADPAKSALIAFGDPYTFPTTELFLPRLNEDFPGLPVVGGMASCPTGPGPQTLFLNDDTFGEGAVGILLQGELGVRTVVSQGCRPIGRPLVMTRGEENIIQELGGQTPFQYLRALYDTSPPADQELLRQGVLLGIAMTEYRDTFQRGDFLIRTLLGIDKQSGAIALTDIVRRGQTVQFHVRDAASASEDLHAMLQQTRASGAKPRGGLLFSCNGRGTRLFSEPHHDAAAISAELGPFPLAGFFAAGELGPVGKKNFIHGFTSSLILFDEC